MEIFDRLGNFLKSFAFAWEGSEEGQRGERGSENRR
jgi:hypothetical protein